MFCIRMPESWNRAFRLWQKQKQKQNVAQVCSTPVKRKRKRDQSVSVETALDLPQKRLQLPLRLFGTHKGQYMELMLWWIDNEDGYERSGRKRSNTIVEIIQVPKSMQHLRGKFVGTVTKSVNLLFDNTQSGWTAWKVKDVQPNLPLQRFRCKYGGPGFKNHPLLSSIHRDFLMSLCHDREKCYSNDAEQVQKMVASVEKESMLEWLRTIAGSRLGAEDHLASPTAPFHESESVLMPDPLCAFEDTPHTMVTVPLLQAQE